MRLKSGIVLLAVMMMSLEGCRAPTPYCPSPVNASAEVKEWMKGHEPLPPYLKDYLKAIGDDQEAIRVNCKFT
jgi:hypothetical protein